ncbi:hypothetical protein ACJ73_03002 [Blastomyces percursus]|uniref:Tf2-1-like SH3-like domain-containing protein n=1 Tax=Blastomyces percursus TaxID=1658174 RepID=A0A1J9Q9X8_9EURO|nr:hypothetical protein ACJ73_03002 [Blastomyces percursus]
MRHGQEQQARYYNQKHLEKVYAPGDEVMLSAKNLRTARPSKKLDSTFHGPYTEEAIGSQAYRLDLPKSYKIHNVFHVSLLEPYHIRDGERPEQPPLMLVDDHEEWEVEEVLDEMTNGFGFPIENATWEPSEFLKNAPGAIKDYQKKLRTTKR